MARIPLFSLKRIREEAQLRLTLWLWVCIIALFLLVAFRFLMPDPLLFFQRNVYHVVALIALVAVFVAWKPARTLALRYPAVLGLLIVFFLASIFSPFQGETRSFTQWSNWLNILRQVSENGILAVGMTIVIIAAGIDLSVGSLLAVAGTLSAKILVQEAWGADMTAWHMGLGLSPELSAFMVSAEIIFACLLTGVALGSVNGLIIHHGRIQPFVATLAMMLAARGIALGLTNNQVVPFPFQPEGATKSFLALGAEIPVKLALWGQSLPAPRVPVLIFFLIAIVGHCILSYTPLGRHLYAIGGNERSALLSGIRVGRVKWFAYMFCGLMAALAGVVHAAQVRSGQPGDGVGFELNAIAAVVIGGTSLMGGVGTILGTVAGTLVIGIIDNFMGLHMFDPNLQKVLKGIIIIAAVLLQRRRA